MNPDQWHKIKKFLMNKLEDLGCPDSMVEPTAEKMADKIIRYLRVWFLI